MAVGAYALTTVEKAKNHLRLTNESLYANAFNVQHIGDGTAATVQVTSTAVVLVKTGGTSAGTDTLLFATYATMATMIAAINALDREGGGQTYQANLLGVGAADSADLVAVAAADCDTAAVTLEYVNEYLIEQLIDAATAWLETLCDRQFMSRDYTEYYDGNGAADFYMNHWPVTKVTRLSVGRENVLAVRCNASGATWATVRSDGTSLILVYDDSSGEQSTSLAYTTYTTVTDLAAQVNATSGWETQSVGDFGDYLTADICDMPAHYAKDDYAYLEVPYAAEADFRCEEDTGRLDYPPGIPCGRQNIYVEYTAGYSTVPADLELACLETVQSLYNRTRRDAELASERLGDYAWTAKSGDGSTSMSSSKGILRRLSGYKRIAV